MSPRDFRGELQALIDRLLAGDIEFVAFARHYIDCFVEEVPEGYFDDQEFEFYSAVHEKAEWTTIEPSTEDRGYGWIDVLEFVQWLRAWTEAFRKGVGSGG